MIAKYEISSFGKRVFRAFLLVTISVALSHATFGQVQYKSQEFSEADGIPVLVKHLPDWENRRGSIRFATSTPELKQAIGERPIAELIDFTAGTEAATAAYDEGQLLIVEFTSPQNSVEADTAINGAIAAANDGRTFYKRIGNYNVVVFDATSRRAAEALIDQVKYEKQITWLGNNPFAISAERAFVITTTEIFFSTLLAIIIGASFAIVVGAIVGWVYFNFRDRRRAQLDMYSDAGGMTRLNLDGLTPDVLPERLLGK